MASPKRFLDYLAFDGRNSVHDPPGIVLLRVGKAFSATASPGSPRQLSMRHVRWDRIVLELPFCPRTCLGSGQCQLLPHQGILPAVCKITRVFLETTLRAHASNMKNERQKKFTRRSSRTSRIAIFISGLTASSSRPRTTPETNARARRFCTGALRATSAASF